MQSYVVALYIRLSIEDYKYDSRAVWTYRVGRRLDPQGTRPISEKTHPPPADDSRKTFFLDAVYL